MRFDIKTSQEVQKYISLIDETVRNNHHQECMKFVKLGSQTVRIVCYSKEFLPLMQKQLTYTLRNEAENFDATIVIWKEEDAQSFINRISKGNVPMLMRMRLEKLMSKKDVSVLELMEKSYSLHNPIVRIEADRGFVKAYDEKTNTYYYGVKDLSPEEFIKEGHIFVQMFNKIAKTENSNLVHGAVVGVDNRGILFCARGQRGKSTLAVLSMMKGFEYVSDDYLILEKEGGNLYSYPIYSIITLSPRMYNELYDDMRGKFVSNNARKDKYVINIEAYHDTFKDKYPIKVCMFPEIVKDDKPSIVPCKKGRSITQLIHSTIRQVEDVHDIKTIRKLINFVKDFDFYQINLCNDIHANVECLREFCNKLNAK